MPKNLILKFSTSRSSPSLTTIEPLRRGEASAGQKILAAELAAIILVISSSCRWSLCLWVIMTAATLSKGGRILLYSTGSQRMTLPSFSIARPECSNLVIFMLILYYRMDKMEILTF